MPNTSRQIKNLRKLKVHQPQHSQAIQTFWHSLVLPPCSAQQKLASSPRFEAFSSGGTVLAIPHGLSSIRDAALILVIDGGQVTHENLVDADGPYAAPWRQQQHHCSLVPLPQP